MDWRSVRRAVFPRRTIRPDVRDEIRFHVEERIRDLVLAGWSEEAARRHVLARFGDPDEVEEACVHYQAQRLERKGWRMRLDAWTRDGRLAVRTMVRNGGFTGVVVVTLALGIGAATAVFSVVEGVLLRPLPFHEPDQLVVIWENDRATGTVRENASTSDYYDFVERNRSFADLAMYALGTAVLTRSEGEPRRLNAALVTANLPGLLGIGMQLGRSFSPEEDQPGGRRAVVLTDHVWRDELGAAPEVLGEALSLDGVPYEVVGVLPPGIEFPAGETDVWLPIQQSPTTATRPNHWVRVVARMAPATTLESAQAEMTAIMADLEVEFAADNTNRGAFVERLSDVGRGDVRRTLWVLFGAVLAVLAIACANVATLLLARGAGRARELAVLSAVGAGASEITRRFFVEGILVTATACLGGLGLATVGVRVLTGLAPAELAVLGQPELNGTVLAFALVVSALIGIGFAVLPALQARGLELPRELKEARTTAGGTMRMTARRLLVAGQLAVAVVLAVSAALLMATLRNLQSVDPGFRADNVLRADFTLPRARYPRDFSKWPDWPEVNGFNRALVDHLEALPAVRSAAIVTNHPLDRGFTNSFEIQGQPYDPAQGEMATRLVTPGYFETAGLTLVEGRLPLESEDHTTPPTIVLNRRAVERYFPDGGAVGSSIAFWGRIFREVVGIVENERIHGLAADVPPAMYVNLLQTPPAATKVTLMVRTELPPGALASDVRRAVWSLDRDLAVFNVTTMEATLAAAAARERFASVILVAFAGVAVFLAVLGVHGVLAYLVSQRRHEVGVRIALGATRRDVVHMVVRQGGAMAVLGIAAGLAASLVVSRALQGLLFGATPTALPAYVGVTAALGLAALAATVLPARRAASVDPMETLRGD